MSYRLRNIAFWSKKNLLSFRKDFKKTSKNYWGARKKQVKILKFLKPNTQLLTNKGEIAENQLGEETKWNWENYQKFSFLKQIIVLTVFSNLKYEDISLKTFLIVKPNLNEADKG